MIRVDESLCNGCGICGEVCPRHITEVVSRDGRKRAILVEERVGLCMHCGHCAAVCPKGAVTVDGLRPEDFTQPEPLSVYEGELRVLLAQRRSVRRYKDRPVPREVLGTIADGAGLAPTGTGSMTTGVIILDGEDRLRELMQLVYADYAALDAALGRSIPRFVVRRKAGKRMFHALESFAMPGVRWYARWYAEGKGDEIRRDCPALMLFTGPADEPMVEANCALAAFHSILVAETLGVGTCFNDLIPPMCNRSAKIRGLLSLPEDREVHASLTLGYAKYPFRRIVPRHLAEVRYVD